MTASDAIPGGAGEISPDDLNRREEALSSGRIVAAMRTLHARLSPRLKREVWWLLALMVLVSLLEAASIASLFPFLDLAAGRLTGDAQPNEVAGFIVRLFGNDLDRGIITAAALKLLLM